LANIFKQLFERLLLPQLKRKPSDFDPLVYSVDSSRVRIKIRFPPTQHQVQATDMPRSTIPDQGDILKSGKPKENPPISQL